MILIPDGQELVRTESDHGNPSPRPGETWVEYESGTRAYFREIGKPFYTYADLQDRWGVVRQTIHREVRRGRLKKTLIGGSVRFAAEDVERYEQQSRTS